MRYYIVYYFLLRPLSVLHFVYPKIRWLYTIGILPLFVFAKGGVAHSAWSTTAECATLTSLVQHRPQDPAHLLLCAVLLHVPKIASKGIFRGQKSYTDIYNANFSFVVIYSYSRVNLDAYLVKQEQIQCSISLFPEPFPPACR